MNRQYIEIEFSPAANSRTYFLIFRPEFFSYKDSLGITKKARYCIVALANPPDDNHMEFIVDWLNSDKTIKFTASTKDLEIPYIYGNLPTTVLNEFSLVESIIEEHFLKRQQMA